MEQQKTVPNITHVELTKGVAAGAFGHDTLSIWYSEAKTGSHRQGMRFAVQFGDDTEGKLMASPGIVLAVAVQGFTLAKARLEKQKEVGSTEGAGEVIFDGIKLPEGKCDRIFREILHLNPERSQHQKPEKRFRLEKLLSATDALNEMYSESLDTENEYNLVSVREAISLLSRISYAARLAVEKVKGEERNLLELERHFQ